MIIHNPILTGSFTVNGTDVSSITSSAASITAINSYTASQNILNGTYATTGSNTFKNPQTINSNLIVTGSITAATLVVQTITSSVVYSSGSNVFGNNIANTQVFTGSMNLTGSLTVVTTGTEFQVNAAGVNFGNALTDSHVISGSLRINPNGLFVSSSGIVGIGTVTPTSSLDVRVAVESPATGKVALAAGTSNGANDIFRWYDGTTQLGVFKNSGNVGIGTSSPSEKLHLYNNTAGTSTTLIIENNFNNQNSQINFKSIYGGSTAKSFLIGSNISVAAGSWEIYDATAAAARLIITSGGDVGIGRTSSNAKLEIQAINRSSSNYAILAYDSSIDVIFGARNDGLINTGLRTYSPYNFSTSGRSAVINSSGELGYLSSIRESKANIESIKSVDFINQLNPVRFNYRKKNSETNEYTDELYDNTNYGFIADEVEKVNKDLVFYKSDGTTLAGVEYNNMIAILTKAIQEQQAQIQNLQAQITELKNK